MSIDGDPDLVVLTLSRVQRFISESKSTSDACSASRIIADLAAQAVKVVGAALGAAVVLPDAGAAGVHAGMPNRVVVLAPAGTGADLARAAKRAVEERWTGWVNALKFDDGEVASAPGFPVVQ